MNDAVLNLVETLDDAQACKRWLGQARNVLGVDTETGGLEWWREPLRMVILGDEQTGWAIPWERWAGLVFETLGEYEDDVVFHNAKFDLHFLEGAGVSIRRDRLHDTQTASHLIDPLGRHGLKPLSVRYLDNRAAVGQNRLAETMRERSWDWRSVPFDYPPYWTYAALDAVLTARLWTKFKPDVYDGKYRDVYDLEIATLLILTDMERRGARIDLDYTETKANELEKFVLDTKAWSKTAFGVNPSSDRQVRARLQEDGVVLTKKTDSGAFSVDESVLAPLDHPLAETVLQVRKASKLASSYFRKFLDLADNDLLHASMNPQGARTGRMSVSTPSLQNLPKKSPLVRNSFIPREGNALISSDFDQIELRLLAHFADETAMIDAIRGGLDLHGETARLVYGEGYTTAQRGTAKNGNFAKVYGAGAQKFADTAGIPLSEAEVFLARYDATFPGVVSFMHEVEAVARTRQATEDVAYVTTPIGRYHPCERGREYALVNYLIQGTAADLLKKTLVALDLAGVGDYMILPVHDEVIFDVPTEQIENVVPVIERTMRDDETYKVPISASAEILAERWGEKYE